MSARARGPRQRGRAPPRCGVLGEAGTAGPGAREQWRSRRGRGGSGPPAPRAPRAPQLPTAARLAGPAGPSEMPLIAPALLSPLLPPPSDWDLGIRFVHPCTSATLLPILRPPSSFAPPGLCSARGTHYLSDPSTSLNAGSPLWDS